MVQKWRDLSFLHWPIPVEQLRPLVPSDLDLDLFEGTAYVGLVPFRMTGVRPIGLPAVPWLSSFLETNVRTYVHRRGREPGVWFFSLDAANALAVGIARAWFHLPYFYSKMTLREVGQSESSTNEAAILYEGERRWPKPLPATYSLQTIPLGNPQPAIPGTLEHFLVERYILYTYSKRQLLRGYVNHTPYPVQSAHASHLSNTLLAATHLQTPSTCLLAHFSRGVDVKVFNLQRVAAEEI